MPSNSALALESHFDSWKKGRYPVEKKGVNVFEYYCVEQFTRAFDLGDSQLKSGIVGKGQDGGVDAFYIFANGELVDAETEINPKEPPEFKILIMQVKSDEGFSPLVIDKFFFFTEDLLDLSKSKADHHSTYHANLITLIRIFKDKFRAAVGETPRLSIEYVYVIQKDVQENEDCLKSAARVRAHAKDFFPQVETDFKFINASRLWQQVQSRPPNKKTLTWAYQPLVTREGMIGLVKLMDLFKFVSDETTGGKPAKLAERLFDSNVRGYWPTSNINKRIADTLKATISPEFWLLNNGITILTDKTGTASGHLDVEIFDPQIVNGLQTSRQIYNYFISVPPIHIDTDDDRRVLVRLIKSSDKITRDEVIRCTNSQNQMPEEALRATDEIHRQLETAFDNIHLFYDRRKGHYREQGKPVDKVISVMDVLQAIVAIVLQRPDEARGRPKDYVKKNELYNSVFGNINYSLTLYLRVTEISRRVSDWLSEMDAEPIHKRNINFYLCMYVSCVMTQNGHADPSKIQKIDVDKISDTLFTDSYNRVFKTYERLADQSRQPNGDRDYDQVAKGKGLLKEVQLGLKKRFNKKQKT